MSLLFFNLKIRFYCKEEKLNSTNDGGLVKFVFQDIVAKTELLQISYFVYTRMNVQENKFLNNLLIHSSKCGTQR